MELFNIILFTIAGFTLSYARYGKPRNGYDVMQLHAHFWKSLFQVRWTSTAGVLLHWVIISRWWEQNQMHNTCRERFPMYKKELWFSSHVAKFQAPKTPRTDTILPEHLLAHTLIIYVYLHYCIWSFCHHFPCKNDVLITSSQAYSNHIFRPQKHASRLRSCFLTWAPIKRWICYISTP